MAEGNSVVSSVSELPISDDEFDVQILINEMQRHYKKVWRYRKASCPNYACEKSSDIAIRYRSEGKIFFEGKDYYKSLISFSQSVAFAPEDSEELISAYAKRAEVLFHYKAYIPCCLDLDRALKKNCTVKQRKVLEKYKAECLDRLKEKCPCPNIESNIIANETISKDCKLCTLQLRHSKIKNERDEKKGRYMVATEKINKAEILSVEEIFVVALDYEKRYSHCSHCLGKFPALIPCKTCTWVMYCSEKCHDCAYNAYHQTECKIVKFYEREGKINFKVVLAVRAFLKGTQQGNNIEELMKTLNLQHVFSGNLGSKSSSNSYFSALELCDLKLQPFDKIPLLSATKEVVPLAVEIIILFRHLMLFGKSNQSQARLSIYDEFAAMLIINNLVSLSRNKFRVMQCIEIKKDRKSAVSQFGRDTFVGYGVYLNHNFIQHSCNPNTFAFIKGHQHVLFALTDIEPGGKLYFTHRYHHKDYPLNKRAERFAKCKFTCNCEACSTEKITNGDDKDVNNNGPSNGPAGGKNPGLEKSGTRRNQDFVFRSYVTDNFAELFGRYPGQRKVINHYYVTEDTEEEV